MLYSSLSLVFGYRQCFARAVHSSAAAFDLDASDVISGQMQGKGAKTEGDTQSKEKGVGEPQMVRYVRPGLHCDQCSRRMGETRSVGVRGCHAP